MVEVMVSMPPLSLTVSVPIGQHVGVVAGAADQRVDAEPAVEDVGGAVAGDGVGEPIAGAVDGGGPQQRQLLDRVANDASERVMVEVMVSMPPYR